MEKEPKLEPKSKVWGWCFFVTLLAALVFATYMFALWKHFPHFHFRRRHNPRPPGFTKEDYGDALGLAMQFFDVQKYTGIDFLAVTYSDYMLKSRRPHLRCGGKLFKSIDLRNFAKSQVDYMMGNNPMGMSYLVGFGKNYPKYVHHRGSSIPVNATTGCGDGFKWLHSVDPNPNIAIGALVGGPFINDTYVDFRNNFMQAEPATYNNALIVGLLSGLLADSPVAQSF